MSCKKDAYQKIENLQQRLKNNSEIKVKVGQVWRRESGWKLKIYKLSTEINKFGQYELIAACKWRDGSIDSPISVRELLKSCELLKNEDM